MADDIPPMTASGSGKSEAEIAFELVSKLKGQGVWGERNITAILDMYAECLDATRGLRQYPGQNRIDAPITTEAETTAPASETQAEAEVETDAAPAAPQEEPPVQTATPAQPVQQAPQQSVPQQAVAQQLTPEQLAHMNAQRQAALQAQQAAQQPVHAQQQMLQQQLKQA